MFEPVVDPTDDMTLGPSEDDLKIEGNYQFGLKRYDKAIECYSKAIVSTIYIATLSFKP